MNKSEAIKAMLSGKKVTHNYFSDDEWMMLNNGDENEYLFEDGVIISATEFWKIRSAIEWLTDWEIFKG